MLEITFNVYYTIALAIVVLMVGDVIKKHVYVLRKFCIPTPVVGGVLFAVLITVLNLSGLCSVSLTSTFNEFFSLLFYAGIGYTASWKMLKKGGPQVIVFLLLSSILVVLQNGLGVIICKIMGVDPLVGLACGSIPMVGGNGTAAAWGPSWRQQAWKPAPPLPPQPLPSALWPALCWAAPLAVTLLSTTASSPIPRHRT